MGRVKVKTILPDYIIRGEELVCKSGGRFVAYQPVKSKAELVAENKELMKRVSSLEQYIAFIKQKGVYITEHSWQSDIPQIVSGLRQEGQAGLLCFIPQNTYQTYEKPG